MTEDYASLPLATRQQHAWLALLSDDRAERPLPARRRVASVDGASRYDRGVMEFQAVAGQLGTMLIDGERCERAEQVRAAAICLAGGAGSLNYALKVGYVRAGV